MDRVFLSIPWSVPAPPLLVLADDNNFRKHACHSRWLGSSMRDYIWFRFRLQTRGQAGSSPWPCVQGRLGPGECLVPSPASFSELLRTSQFFLHLPKNADSRPKVTVILELSPEAGPPRSSALGGPATVGYSQDLAPEPCRSRYHE